jgi:hypothetical protein
MPLPRGGQSQPSEPEWQRHWRFTAASGNESFLKSFVVDGCHSPTRFVKIETRRTVPHPRAAKSGRDSLWPVVMESKQCQRVLLPRLQRREFKAAAER